MEPTQDCGHSPYELSALFRRRWCSSSIVHKDTDQAEIHGGSHVRTSGRQIQIQPTAEAKAASPRTQSGIQRRIARAARQPENDGTHLEESFTLGIPGKPVGSQVDGAGTGDGWCTAPTDGDSQCRAGLAIVEHSASANRLAAATEARNESGHFRPGRRFSQFLSRGVSPGHKFLWIALTAHHPVITYSSVITLRLK